MLVKGYCDGCEKIKDGVCSTYLDPCKKTGADRWNDFLGCSFSPLEKQWRNERYLATKPQRRVGQPKSKKKVKELT